MPDILVVDDESDIRHLVKDCLEMAGFSVRMAASGAEMRAMVADRAPDLVVLDVTMPGEDGFGLARHLRERSECGIIMLTASSGLVDRVVGLEVGADDYIIKPFEPDDLLGRIQAVLRRRRPASNDPALPPGCFSVGRFIFTPGDRKLVDSAGQEVRLSALEAELLAGFAAHPGEVLSRDDLLDLAPPRSDEPFDRSIDNRIKRLRRKIEIDPEKPDIIKTVRGGGYVFVGKEPPARRSC